MSRATRPLWKSLYFQVLIAVALGVLVGWLWPAVGAALKPLGDGFIKLVKTIARRSQVRPASSSWNAKGPAFRGS